MVRAGRPGISRATRSEFRNLMTSVVVGAIDDAFNDEEFQPLGSITYTDTSVRRSRTEEYLQAVDWHDTDQVRRVLRVFERLISRYLQEVAGDTTYLARLRRELSNNGYQLTDEVRILRIGPQLPAGSLANLQDSAAIEEQLDRLAGAADDDPALAVVSRVRISGRDSWSVPEGESEPWVDPL